MHRIEDILRQLNTVSAKIQPELASHLQQIQQRLDRAHEATEHRPFHAQTPPPSPVSMAAAAPGAARTNDVRTFGSSSGSTLGSPSLKESRSAPFSHTETPIVEATSPTVASIALWTDSPHENFPDVSTISRPNSTLVEQPINQPHEPTTPHFVLRQNITATPRSKSNLPGTMPDNGPADPKEANPDPKLVSLNTDLDSSVGLPLFESLWFRQAAPNAYAARLVDRLLQKVPATVPAVLHFCQDLQSQASSSLVSTQLAWELSRRGLGEVLLVDADFGHRDISRQLGHVYLPGLSEWINLGLPMEDLVRPTGVENLSWLPSGSGDISFRRIAGGRWAEISLQLRQRFQWVCVHAGAAQDRVTSTWGRFCDYTYLITNMDDELGPATKQVVDLLRATECRVSGLITID